MLYEVHTKYFVYTWYEVSYCCPDEILRSHHTHAKQIILQRIIVFVSTYIYRQQ